MGACRLASAGLSFMELLQAIENFVEWKKIKTKKEVATYYVSYLKGFWVFMKNKKITLEEVSIDDVTEFISFNQAAGFSESNVQARAVCLKSLFTYYHMLGYSVINPYLIQIPEVGETLPRVADPKDYRKIIDDLEKDRRPHGIRNLAIFKIYYTTGIRRTELIKLNLSDLDLREKTITIKTQKIRRERLRSIRIPPHAIESILRWLEIRNGILDTFRDKDALFVSLDAHKFGCRLGKGGINEMFRRFKKKLGIEGDLTPHTLRHLFAKDATLLNVNSLKIAQMLGHRNVNTTRRYTRLFGKDLHKQYALVRH